MMKWFKTKDRIFWISAFLLSMFIINPATADTPTFTVTPYAGSPTIIRNGQVVSPPIYVGDTVTVPISGVLTCSGSNNSGQECTIDSVNFSFPGASIAYSNDGGKTFTSGGGSVGISGVDAAHGTATLTATFQNGGYYKITYNVSASYTSSTCGNGSASASGNLAYAVSAGDFGFSLNPTSLSINQGEAGTTSAQIKSYQNFSSAVNFSAIAADVAGISASGSVTPPANGTTTAAINVSVGSSVPLGTHNMFIRGSSTVGTLVLAHDQPLTVAVAKRGVTVTPADQTYHKGSGGSRSPDVPDANGVTSINIVKPTGHKSDGSLFSPILESFQASNT